jgi:hypothetical protein
MIAKPGKIFLVSLEVVIFIMKWSDKGVEGSFQGCKYETFIDAFMALQVWVSERPNRQQRVLETAFNHAHHVSVFA